MKVDTMGCSYAIIINEGPRKFGYLTVEGPWCLEKLVASEVNRTCLRDILLKEQIVNTTSSEYFNDLREKNNYLGGKNLNINQVPAKRKNLIVPSSLCKFPINGSLQIYIISILKSLTVPRAMLIDCPGENSIKFDELTSMNTFKVSGLKSWEWPHGIK